MEAQRAKARGLQYADQLIQDFKIKKKELRRKSRENKEKG